MKHPAEAKLAPLFFEDQEIGLTKATIKAQTGKSVSQSSIETAPNANIVTNQVAPPAKYQLQTSNNNQTEKWHIPNTTPYHHSGTWGYLDISLAWMSGCSFIERLAWIMSCFRK